jgi:hypothetical protein
MRISPGQLLQIVLLLLLGLDTAYAFLQYFYQPLDGDMAWNLVPAAEVRPILSDPLGWKALTQGMEYPNPNRFFSHWFFREYLLGVPLLLQRFVSPITSVYLAAALAKIFVHLGLVGLLARAITGPGRKDWRSWLIAACLIAPFFQSGEFRSHIGIVDAATTYVFFYALPAGLLLLFALPFVDRFIHSHQRHVPAWQLLLWSLLAFVVCLSGPLNPGVVLVAGVLAGAAWLAGRFRLAEVPGALLFLAILAGALSLYSLYLGRYNTLTIDNQLPLTELYAKLPAGIFRQFTGKLAFPVLVAMLGLNYFLLRKKNENRPLVRLFGWVLAFAALYFLLLPLGGFRGYRANILRYDTILPATLAFIGLYAASSLQLLRRLDRRSLGWYLPLLLVIVAIYTNADRFDRTHYDCERAALERIAASPEDEVALEENCSVVLWKTYKDAHQSEMTGRLLHRWQITDRPKTYFHPGATGE